jgi:hypothetical protein
MIPRDDARRLLQLALDEFAPRWEIAVDPVEVTIRDPHHWLSGIGTFGATLRERATGSLKVLGRRTGPEQGAAFHRGISGMVLEAFLEGSADPIHRYLCEIGVAAGSGAPSERLIASGGRLIRTKR